MGIPFRFENAKRFAYDDRQLPSNAGSQPITNPDGYSGLGSVLVRDCFSVRRSLLRVRALSIGRACGGCMGVKHSQAWQCITCAFTVPDSSGDAVGRADRNAPLLSFNAISPCRSPGVISTHRLVGCGMI